MKNGRKRKIISIFLSILLIANIFANNIYYTNESDMVMAIGEENVLTFSQIPENCTVTMGEEVMTCDSFIDISGQTGISFQVTLDNSSVINHYTDDNILSEVMVNDESGHTEVNYKSANNHVISYEVVVSIIEGKDNVVSFVVDNISSKALDNYHVLLDNETGVVAKDEVINLTVDGIDNYQCYYAVTQEGEEKSYIEGNCVDVSQYNAGDIITLSAYAVIENKGVTDTIEYVYEVTLETLKCSVVASIQDSDYSVEQYTNKDITFDISGLSANPNYIAEYAIAKTDEDDSTLLYTELLVSEQEAQIVYSQEEIEGEYCLYIRYRMESESGTYISKACRACIFRYDTKIMVLDDTNVLKRTTSDNSFTLTFEGIADAGSGITDGLSVMVSSGGESVYADVTKVNGAYTATVTDLSSSYEVSCILRDNAGNESIYSFDSTIDVETPIINISATSMEAEYEESTWTNQDVNISVTAYDSQSELYSSICNIYRDEVLIDSINMDIMDKTAQLSYEFTKEGMYRVEVIATDRVDGGDGLNEARLSYEVNIDKSIPVVSFIDNNKLVNSDNSVDISIDDKMGIIEYADICVSDIEGNAIYEEHILSEDIIDGVISYSFLEDIIDGEYIISIKACDMAGNEVEEAKKYILDNTLNLPVVILTDEDNNEVTQGIYSLTDINVNITALDDNGIDSIEVYDNDVLSASHKYMGSTKAELIYAENNEGTRHIRVVCSDIAGNTVETEVIVMIDSKAPHDLSISYYRNGVDITDVYQHKSSMQDTTKAVFSAVDDESEIQKVVYRVLDKDMNCLKTGETIEGEVALCEVFADLDDGEYVIEYTMYDMAYNKAVAYSNIITCDNEKPVITLVSITGVETSIEYSNNEYIPEPVEVIISVEDNRDDIASIIYTVNGTDTVVEDSELGEGRYEIKIYLEEDKADNVISVSAVDNSQNETVADKICSFGIDKTMPVVKLTGYEGQWVKNSVTVGISNSASNISECTYYYRTDNSDWSKIEDNTSFIITDGGGYHFKIISASGIESQEYYTYVNMDNELPSNAFVKISAPDGENNWYASYPSIEISEPGADGGSNITTYYKLYKSGSIGSTVTYTGNNPVITSDGTYILEVYTVDGAGNRCSDTSYYKQTLRIDTNRPSMPTITFTSDSSPIKRLLNFVSFNYFCKNKVTVHVTASDYVSNISQLRYKFSENGKWITKNVSGSGDMTFTVEPDYKGKLYVCVVDKAGNISEIAVSKGLVVENRQSVISINSDKDMAVWQSTDVNAYISASDMQSGIASIECKVNGKTVQTQDFTKRGDVTYNYSCKVRCSEEAVNGMGYELEVTVTDNAGVVTTKRQLILIDKTAPVIEVSGIENDSYSNVDRALTVKVTESIYEHNNVYIDVIRTLDGITETYSDNTFNSYSYISQGKFLFSKEGTYNVTVHSIDSAGNEAKPVNMVFTIDKTAPVVGITGVVMESYNANDITTVVSVEESNYSNVNIDVEAVRIIDGNTEYVDYNATNISSRYSLIQRTFSEDGEYIITVNATDAAGNSAIAYSITFYIDKTAPIINVDGVERYMITSKSVSAGIHVTDSFYNTLSIDGYIYLTDAYGREKYISLGSMTASDRESVFEKECTRDGIYSFTVRAVDAAGNETIDNVQFTIDTESPQIRYIDRLNGEYFKSFSFGYDISRIIEELTIKNYKLTLNGLEYDGEELITENGKYVLKLEVEDEVGNKSYATAKFYVDNTPPEVLITGIENGEVYYEDVETKIVLLDEEDKIDYIKINGQEQEVSEDADVYYYRFSNIGRYTIEVGATDIAGNEVVKLVVFEYTDKVFEAFLRNNKEYVISIFVGGLIVAIVCANMMMFGRRNKKIDIQDGD